MWQDTRSTKKKSVALLYTKDREAEREIRETSPFTTATNNIKYLGGNSNQGSERSIHFLYKDNILDCGGVWMLKLLLLLFFDTGFRFGACLGTNFCRPKVS